MNQTEYELIAEVFAIRRAELKSVSACTTIDEKDPARIEINRSFSEWHIILNALTSKFEEEYSSFDRAKFEQAAMRGAQ